MDSNSGAVHLLDDTAYDCLSFIDDADFSDDCPEHILLALGGKYSPDAIREAYADLLALYQEKTLFSEDTYAPFAEKMGPAPVKSLCLNVAHDCNLRCEYCFASQGDFGKGKKLMPFAVGRAAIDFMVENSFGRRNLEVDFFGGEPLMNFGVVKQIVDYARSIEQAHKKNFRFTITTNGVLLNDEIIDYINKEMVNVVLSLDGRREVNDNMRPSVNGKGSYDVIVPKYQSLVARRGGKQYYLRGTFTKDNLDFSKDILHIYEDLGFDQVSVEPAVLTEDVPFSLRDEDYEAIAAEYERLAEIVIAKKKAGEKLNFFHFQMELDGGPCAIKRLRGCSCGNEYVAVTPEGDIYPCHQFVGEDEWKMGNVLDGTLNAEMKQEFAKATVYSKDDCKNCWAKFYCSGGCNANNHQFNRSIYKPHKLSCDLEKKRVECAIMIKAALL